MSFFYDLNKKLDSIRATPEVTHQQLNERDMSRAAKGYEKYGKQGMQALAKAGREGKALDPVRKKYDKYDNDQVDEDMYNQGGVYKDLEIEPKRPQQKEKGMTRGTRPAPKGEFMGTIKGGVWTADPPKPGEKGVPVPMDPEGVKEAGMTPKQKSFAKLAPPANKITFADKIAGAKKEVDEMLGDVAAEAMRNALSPKQKKIDMNKNGKLDANDFAMLRKGAKPEMDEERSKGTAFDMSTPRAAKPKVGSVERGHKHDIKHTATGRMVTRRVDDQGNSVGADDDADTQAGPRGRGRPKGTKGAIGAKGPSGKSKLMTKEGEVDIRDQGEYDQEGDMAKNDIKTIVRHAQALSKVLGDDDNLPEWVQSKLAKIEGMMISVDEYMQNQADDDEAIAEEPKSKNQAVAARIARGVQKGTAKAKPGSASAEMAKMQPKELNKFAKGSTKGLPKKVSKNKEEVDETSEEGRITTTRTGPGKTLTTSSTGRVSATIGNGKMSVKPGKPEKQMDDDTDTASVSNKDTSPAKSSSGMSFGKGIYDSMNRELEQMIAESMSINMSDSTEGNKSLTVTATDDDAMKLAMMLKSAGLGGQGRELQSDESCSTCGMPDCGCGDVQEAVDENAPDWPTNTETSSDALQYAGGLNKPKADVAGNGQSTVPVVATRPHNDDDLRRMMEMAGIRTEDNIDLGPASPEVARMSKDEVNAALRSGMNSKVDLGPTSPDIASMSNDEVNAALTLGLSPDISGMDPDSVNAEFGKDDRQYEDSMQRMREMAGIREAKKQVDQNNDGKNDFEDIKIARMKASGAIDDKEEKKVDESIFALTNQWKAYKGKS
jgi:hypothetical protein